MSIKVRKAEESLMGAFGVPDTEDTKTITTSGTAAAATGLFAQTWYRAVCSEDAHLHFHASGDATTSHMFMKAGVPEIFYTGDLTRVSAIQNSTAGVVYLTPMQITVDQD